MTEHVNVLGWWQVVGAFEFTNLVALMYFGYWVCQIVGCAPLLAMHSEWLLPAGNFVDCHDTDRFLCLNPDIPSFM
jgi:hypothetical protein